MCLLVLSLLEVCHETVDNVFFWGKEVEGIGIGIRRPAVGDQFNV